MNETLITALILIALQLLFSFRGLKKQSVLEKYRFETGRILSYQEYYRLLSYSFFHLGWLQLGLNMLGLFVFAAFLAHLSWLVFLSMYGISVMFSSLFALLVYRHQPNYSYAGASAAVYAMGFGAIVLSPGARLLLFGLLPVPAWVFVVVLIALAFYAVRSKAGPDAHAVQLAGGLAGMIGAVLLAPALFAGNYAGVLLVTAPVIVAIFLALVRPELLGIRESAPAIPSAYYDIDDAYNSRRADNQKELDRLLDKISQQGIDSLTSKERQRLEELSR